MLALLRSTGFSRTANGRGETVGSVLLDRLWTGFTPPLPGRRPCAATRFPSGAQLCSPASNPSPCVLGAPWRPSCWRQQDCRQLERDSGIATAKRRFSKCWYSTGVGLKAARPPRRRLGLGPIGTGPPVLGACGLLVAHRLGRLQWGVAAALGVAGVWQLLLVLAAWYRNENFRPAQSWGPLEDWLGNWQVLGETTTRPAAPLAGCWLLAAPWAGPILRGAAGRRCGCCGWRPRRPLPCMATRPCAAMPDLSI